MNDALEMSGKTIEEALEKALEELQLREDEVEVEVLEEGEKKMLGLLGGKEAVIRVSRIVRGAEVAERFLVDVLNMMEVEADMYIEEGQELIEVKISGDDVGLLIGRRGETLDALQYLTGLAVNRKNVEYKRVLVDVENYRAKREETLRRVANKTAKKVIKTRRKFKLEPMNPYERRIIHSELQQNGDIETYSVGEEPNRRVVVSLKK